MEIHTPAQAHVVRLLQNGANSAVLREPLASSAPLPPVPLLVEYSLAAFSFNLTGDVIPQSTRALACVTFRVAPWEHYISRGESCLGRVDELRVAVTTEEDRESVLSRVLSRLPLDPMAREIHLLHAIRRVEETILTLKEAIEIRPIPS